MTTENKISSFEQLKKLYALVDMTFEPSYSVEYDEETQSYQVVLESDGKLIITDEFGCGSTEEEALNDATDRFFSHTPTIDDVPLRKLLKLID